MLKFFLLILLSVSGISCNHINCNYTFNIINSWPGGFQSEVSFISNIDTNNGWDIELKVLDKNISVTDYWNAVVKDKGNGAFSLKNESWNGIIPKNTLITNIGIVFKILTSSLPTKSIGFALNGVQCKNYQQEPEPSCRVCGYRFVITQVWENHFQTLFSFVSNVALNNWFLDVKYDGNVSYSGNPNDYWNMQVALIENGLFQMSNIEWNKKVPANILVKDLGINFMSPTVYPTVPELSYIKLNGINCAYITNNTFPTC